MMATAFATHTQHTFFFLFSFVSISLSIHGVYKMCNAAEQQQQHTKPLCQHAFKQATRHRTTRSSVHVCTATLYKLYVHSGESLYRVQQTERKKRAPDAKTAHPSLNGETTTFYITDSVMCCWPAKGKAKGRASQLPSECDGRRRFHLVI